MALEVVTEVPPAPPGAYVPIGKGVSTVAFVVPPSRPFTPLKVQSDAENVSDAVVPSTR